LFVGVLATLGEVSEALGFFGGDIASLPRVGNSGEDLWVAVLASELLSGVSGVARGWARSAFAALLSGSSVAVESLIHTDLLGGEALGRSASTFDHIRTLAKLHLFNNLNNLLNNFHLE